MTVALARDDSAQAKVHAERLLTAAKPLNNPRARAIAHLGQARALLLEGDDERAESITHDALKVLMDNAWRPGVINALDVIAEVAFLTGQRDRGWSVDGDAGVQRAGDGRPGAVRACRALWPGGGGDRRSA